MTCIKTGARVYIESHNWVVPADLFKVGDCIVIHFNTHCKRGVMQPDEATHIIRPLLYSRDEYWDESLGIIVVPASTVVEVNNGK